jgi:hypothetical protein
MHNPAIQSARMSRSYSRACAAPSLGSFVTLAMPDYASTTEASRHLIEQLDLPARAPCGRLIVLGRAGNDLAAHALHLRTTADLTRAPLAKRWAASHAHSRD